MTDGNILEANFQEGSRKWPDKFFVYTLAAFFFLLPFQTRYFLREAPFYEYGTLSVFLVEALGWVVVGLGLLKIREYRNIKLRLRGIFLYSCILVFLSFLSIAWAPDKTVALQGAVRLLEGMLFYIVVAQTFRSERGRSKDLRYMLWWSFIAGATLQSLLGIYQFLTQSTFASTLLGMAFHDPVAAGTAVVEFGDERWLRAYGGLPHPNILGGYLVVALAVLVISYKRLQEVTGGYPEPEQARYGAGKMLLVKAVVPILITGIFFSFSRAAWIAGIGLLSYWIIGLLLKFRHSEARSAEESRANARNAHARGIPSASSGQALHSLRSFRMTKGFFYVLLTTLYVLFLVLMFRPLVATRLNLQSPERLEIKARVERASGVRESWELIKKHPVLGVGIDNYTQGIRREVRPGDALYTYQPVHNVPLLIWAELGIAGLLLFIGILGSLWRQSQNYILLTTFYILLLFDHYLWSLPFGILLFWAVLGLSTKYSPQAT